MIRGFSHMQLAVTDVATSAAWYCDVLGMEQFVSGDIDSGPYVGLRNREAGLVIGMHTRVGSAANETLVDHLSFAVEDLAALTEARDMLVQRGHEVAPVFDEAVSHNVQLRDPDGLRIELTAPKTRV